LPYKKIYFAAALSALLVLGFIATSIISYFVAHDSLTDRIADESLPLTSDNVYSEIEQDLLRSVLISSLMAHDTFVRDWTIRGERNPQAIIRYLREIEKKYDTTTAFFVSDRTHKYYHPRGVLKTVKKSDPNDAWYFHVRNMDQPYQINVDRDTADPQRLTIFVNYRVTDYDGNYIGATGIGLSVNAVAKLIESYQKRYGRQIYFVNRDGRVTLHGDHFQGPERLQDAAGLRKVATRILASPSTSAHYTDAQGHTVYINSRLIPQFNWYLIVAQSEQGADTRILNTLMLNIAIALAVTVLVLLTAWFTIRGYQMRLEQMATTDELSGAASRQVFDVLYDQAVKLAKRHGGDVSLVAIDIDGFKTINDTHGHAAGDAVIRALCGVIRERIRESDTLCRWGGDEFLLLLSECSAEHARETADAIRSAMATRVIRHAGAELRVTISAGVVQRREGEDIEAMVARADAAMYESKSRGRDQVNGA